jgi:hypothetical protein
MPWLSEAKRKIIECLDTRELPVKDVDDIHSRQAASVIFQKVCQAELSGWQKLATVKRPNSTNNSTAALEPESFW